MPPDPKLYEQAARDPTVGKLTGIQQIGLTPVVRVELRPVQLSERGALELLSEIEVTLAYGPRPERQSPVRLKSLLAEYGIHDVDVERLMPMPEPQIVSRAQAEDGCPSWPRRWSSILSWSSIGGICGRDSNCRRTI